MEQAGHRLKQARERLDLKYRDVEEATSRIAAARKNDEFLVSLSRLSDIENKGTLPSIYRLYSLCAVYRLDINQVLSWYGISLDQLPADSGLFENSRTHLVGFRPREDAEVQVPISLDPGLDLSKTVFLSRMIERWGRLPLLLLKNADLRNQLYGLMGSEDWSMFPLVPPGALLVIDETRRRIMNDGWTTEFERPIYFLEHRDGYACGWCTLNSHQLILQPHPSSQENPQVFRYPDEIEILGQVTAVAMTLEFSRRRRPRK